ncbi:MAG: V-type ATP synthase subunit D [Candidatus Omnitrophica bacterium]|nr:V-type ATP synthase subunit D [Candidatus Omnitrophota bacterium]
MAKIKLTKGELKRQRDALRQYRRYLPTLQLKKQQLQMEIVRQVGVWEGKMRQEVEKRKAQVPWAGLLAEGGVNVLSLLGEPRVVTYGINIAGVDIEIFERVDFSIEEYDLYLIPLWVDAAVEIIKTIVALRKEIEVLDKGIQVLRRELRITTQRVNLFEKVKIPEAEETIRLIKIYIGDQMANAVGRSKIAKRKLDELVFEGVAA